MSNQPTDAPPSYEQVTSTNTSTHKTRNGIPIASRRSMEDEHRPLPPGWVRQYDAKQSHQFFVDTKCEPPRSIWHHPYDDERYLSSLPTLERQRIQGLHRMPTEKDIEAESTDEEGESDHKGGVGHKSSHLGVFTSAAAAGGSAQRPQANRGNTGPSSDGSDIQSIGRRWKDKLTSSTHEEREARRAQRAKEEQAQYEAHMAFRQAMSRAAETGQPVMIGRDREGHDVYVEPPTTGYGGGYGGYGGRAVVGGYTGGARGYNPYSQGPYANPNARFIAPPQPYGRPYGGGYGGGYGMPMMGGLMGGMMLGGLMF